MDKDVYITIKSTQKTDEDDQTESTELFTVGRMYKNNNKYSFNYAESEATGFEGSSVTLNIENEDLVTLVRTGKATSNLIIERGKRHHCYYGTEFGDFMIGISTDEIKTDMTDHGGNLYLKYTVDINSSLMSVNELFINVKEQN